MTVTTYDTISAALSACMHYYGIEPRMGVVEYDQGGAYAASAWQHANDGFWYRVEYKRNDIVYRQRGSVKLIQLTPDEHAREVLRERFEVAS